MIEVGDGEVIRLRAAFEGSSLCGMKVPVAVVEQQSDLAAFEIRND